MAGDFPKIGADNIAIAEDRYPAVDCDIDARVTGPLRRLYNSANHFRDSFGIESGNTDDVLVAFDLHGGVDGELRHVVDWILVVGPIGVVVFWVGSLGVFR